MKTLNLTTKRGDTFYSVPFQITINNTALDLTGSVIKMQLRKDAGTPIIYTPSLTITNATNGEFKIDEQIIDVCAGVYKYDIEITLANSEVHSWISGIFEITNDITR
jgi:hypothetical protein